MRLFIAATILIIACSTAFAKENALPKGYTFADDRFEDGKGLACQYIGQNKKLFFKISKDKKWVSEAKFENDKVSFNVLNQTSVLIDRIIWKYFILDRKSLDLRIENSDTVANCEITDKTELENRAEVYLQTELKKNKI